MKARLRITAVSLTCLSAACWATTVIPMSVEDLTHAASDVVEARAISSRAAWNTQHTLIYTYTTFQVTRSLKGSSAQTFVLKQLGGSAEGYTQKVSGIRHAQAGEDALLFLRPSAAADGTYVIVGLLQGDFRVLRSSDGTALVSNGVSGVKSIRGRVVSNFAGSPMTLSEAESRVRRASQ